MVHSNVDRRDFLTSSTMALATLASSGAFAKSPVPSRTFEYGHPLREFGYGDVQLGAGPHKAQLEQTHEILMGLDEESLLRPFRHAAGMPAPGLDLGGWYSATPQSAKGGASGPETFGQWISALSRYHAATGDKASREKVARLVSGYSETVEPSGRAFRYSNNTEYFYDKLVRGLEDAYALADLPVAADLISATTDAFRARLAGRAIDQLGPETEKAGETYTVPENQFIAWQQTGEPSRLDMAKAYLADDFLFDALAAGHNVLPGRHAYSHANALSSAAKAYLVLGDEKYIKAAISGFRFMEEQSHVTGAWGTWEFFVPGRSDPRLTGWLEKQGIRRSALDSLGEAVRWIKYHFETPCGSYAHFKLTRYLLRITKDPHYGDSMERVMYNCALGALPLNQFGKAFYQSNYSKYATKTYFDGYNNLYEDEWPCCSGTLPQLAADYRINAYLRDDRGVFVNLYIPSTLTWSQAGARISLTQTGEYPLADSMSFGIEAAEPTRFALRFRIPAWAVSPTILVNGEPVSEQVRPGQFAEITRIWRNSDRIEVTLPKQLEVMAVDAQHPDLVALVNGPIVLFAIGNDLPKMSPDTLLAARQTGPSSPEWRSAGIRFLPWWIIKDEVYTTYHDVS